MTTQQSKADAFRALHRKGDPLVLFNVWDAGTATIVAQSGARALATGSFAVAAAAGYADGEKMPWSMALEPVHRIVAITDLPLTMDIESGYGDMARTVKETVEAGAVGFNIEDRLPGRQELLEIDAQVERLKIARQAADRNCDGVFINARTDVFLANPADSHDGALLDHALQRAVAYQQAGADGIFVPGLVSEELIRRLCDESPIPVNALFKPEGPSRQTLADLGVARISFGPGTYKMFAKEFSEAAAAALSGVSA